MSLEKYNKAIQACLSCAIICETCNTECLLEKNRENVNRCIALTQNCSAICFLTARLLASQTEFASQLCDLCMEVCEACAAECSKNYMDSCAASCQQCADECRMLSLQLM